MRTALRLIWNEKTELGILTEPAIHHRMAGFFGHRISFTSSIGTETQLLAGILGHKWLEMPVFS
jgi:hypothetical protein